ncbi:MAG TPA: family 1 glycosylhydrolase, partial [Microbacterium sp.]|nr:family 1 glycosylhydrolase [Microbacterium sp.]
MTTPWYRDGALHFGVGIEDTFVPQERPGERAIDEYALTEHDIRWHDDLALAAEVGADFVRWGVPWYRVQPEPGRFDWSWLDRVFARFAELGIRPIVDLMHYGTPLWMPGQFDDADYPQRVAEYSVQVAERYADTVTDY